MPLGTATLVFGREFSFFTGHLFGNVFYRWSCSWTQTPSLCSVVSCTSLWLSQVLHIIGCCQPIILVNSFSFSAFSLAFGAVMVESQPEPIMRGRHEKLLESRFLPVLTLALGWSWEQVGLIWHPSHENLPQKSVYLKELTQVLDIFYPLAEGKVVHTSE